MLVSENGGLFGFMEVGYRSAIVLSIVLDVTAVVLLAAFLFLRSRPDGPAAQTWLPTRSHPHEEMTT